MMKWCEAEGMPVIALLIKTKGHNEQKLVPPPNKNYEYQKRMLNLILEGEKKKNIGKQKN